MRHRDRYRFIEQTIFFPKDDFVAEFGDEALSLVEDHLHRLRRLHDGLKVAYCFEHDCDGEGYFRLLLYVPEQFGVAALQERARKLWSERLSGACSNHRKICPVQWLEEISCSPFSEMIHVDDDIWCAYYFQMDSVCRSQGNAAFR